ncbi:hypothetical protein SHKM778_33910 [Streptomyces sp. KM77-8]|uniref:Glycerate kinase n=1 Tax=Streptomyces haneummycinicus TaxID=3074435 RepID=A0AAT9HHV7_9ACTN
MTAAYALRDGTAVVEMAEASGLQRLPSGVLAPLTASTYGSGELLRAALDAGARSIVFGVGGSATTDGGAGMLSALGARFVTASGEPVAPGAGARRAGVRRSVRAGRAAGLRGVRAGQRRRQSADRAEGRARGVRAAEGASPKDVERLDAALAHFAKVLEVAVGPKAAEYAASPGAGAAGGIGYGALLLGAAFRPGIEVMLDVLGFASALERADLVITGRDRWTSRRCTGRRRWGSPRRRGPRTRRWSRCAGAWCCRRRYWGGRGFGGPTP